MSDVIRVHTADLGLADRSAIRRLLDDAFPDGFSDDDWDHTLGGVHAFVRDGEDVVAHVSVVQRQLIHREQAIRTGYVEGLAVREDQRRLGHARRLMSAAEQVIASAYCLGALSDGSGIPGFYQQRGWLTWQGPTWVLTTDGMRRTEDDDGGVLVLPTPMSPDLAVAEAIACDWRSGDVW